MPALSTARQQSKSLVSLSPSRQPCFRWADAISPYMQNTEVYMSPQLDEADRIRMNKPFNHTTTNTSPTAAAYTQHTKFFGGYGYNWQYLGNGRLPAGAEIFQAKE